MAPITRLVTSKSESFFCNPSSDVFQPFLNRVAALST
jgi:hypothetical protein